MPQLNLFKDLGVKILDARENEENVKKKKQQATKKATAAKKATTSKEISNRNLTTWEIEFYDKDLAQRLAWYATEYDKDAVTLCKKAWGRSIEIKGVKRSGRTIEEIEALN